MISLAEIVRQRRQEEQMDGFELLRELFIDERRGPRPEWRRAAGRRRALERAQLPDGIEDQSPRCAA